ncbi:MAG: 4a-hydroxytetrahydrobiopterin dehydratase [Clostridia bacterium]|nr:4a-hydroxytetrahydrobiopterin dehydratase [Clostridia bacterium]
MWTTAGKIRKGAIGVPVLSPEERSHQLAGLVGWEDGGDEIRKRFAFSSFPQAMEFVAKVAELANRRNHHPDILIQYDKVTLILTTHREGGVTEKDIAFAQAVDALSSQ